MKKVTRVFIPEDRLAIGQEVSVREPWLTVVNKS